MRKAARISDFMTKYPDDYNPIGQYFEEMKSGKIKVSKKIFRTYRKLVNDMQESGGKYHYSVSRANHVIEFIESE